MSDHPTIYTPEKKVIRRTPKLTEEELRILYPKTTRTGKRLMKISKTKVKVIPIKKHDPELTKAMAETKISDAEINALFPETVGKRITRSFRREVAKTIVHNMLELRAKVRKAENLAAWMKYVYKVVPREFKDPAHPSLELTINIILFGGALHFDWGTYLLYFPSGREIFVKAINNPNARVVLGNTLVQVLAAGQSLESIEKSINILRGMVGNAAPDWFFTKVGPWLTTGGFVTVTSLAAAPIKGVFASLIDNIKSMFGSTETKEEEEK